MNKLRKLMGILIVGMVLLISGCKETIPAGYVGKILDNGGFQPEVYPPSRITMPFLGHSELILVETTTQKFVEPIKVLLKDKLTLNAEIVFRGRVTQNKEVLNTIFNDMKIKGEKILTEDVYFTYGKMVILNTAREVISKYSVDEVNKNYGRITKELYNELQPKLVGLPIDISDVTIGNIEYPKIVTEAIEKAKQRRMAIEQEQAQAQIELTRVRGQEQVAKAQYRIKMMEAKRQHDYNKMISASLTPRILKARELEIREKLVEAIKENKNVIYMPHEFFNKMGAMKTIK